MIIRKRKALTNWGGFPAIDADEVTIFHESELAACFKQYPHAIARGQGRCYGDSSLSHTVISTRALNHFIAFDKVSGIITCEAGVTFKEILEVILPAGWFLPVTPGTKYVSLGGAIAANVHGKNHHQSGALSNHLLTLCLALSDGRILTCSRQEHADLFEATCGGMGLTGVILTASLQLMRVPSAYVYQTCRVTHHLQDTLEQLVRANEATYTVAWMDCLAPGSQLGRAIIYAGEHATTDQLPAALQNQPYNVSSKRKKTVPFYFPSFILNRMTMRLFNEVYFRKHRRKPVSTVIDHDTFFYPLDHILHWNRIYGRRGFVQYQFVLPFHTSEQGLHTILKAVQKSKYSPFLVVLKLMGKEDNPHSFPLAGYTLAMDFPLKKGLLSFLESLDTTILTLGGRFYLAKDARMPAEVYQAMQANQAAFSQQKKALDPTHFFKSLQSERLNIQ